jgi:xylan 1,4-beta-xylosidase
MGSPSTPDRDQYRELEAASRLALLDAPATVRVEHGAVTLRFTLPRQAVSLATIEWP